LSKQLSRAEQGMMRRPRGALDEIGINRVHM
jgi:hypothetical protein